MKILKILYNIIVFIIAIILFPITIFLLLFRYSKSEEGSDDTINNNYNDTIDYITKLNERGKAKNP